jgi:hypothetical protein
MLQFSQEAGHLAIGKMGSAMLGQGQVLSDALKG